MIEVYTEKDIVFIPKLQTLLEHGISTFIRNESLSHAEVQIPVFFPALCIVNKSDLEKAKSIIEPAVEEMKSAPISEIICPSCAESNPSSFEICWSCEANL